MEAFERVEGYWNPHILTSLNGQELRLAKFKGTFPRHQHQEEDEMFWVVKGAIRIVFDDSTVTLNAGDIITVPRGKPHQPEADEEAWVVLFEPAATVNTGNINNEFTRQQLKQL